MGVRWGTFVIGLGLLLAPLFLGYASAASILRDVSFGTLVCVTTLAALQWPRVRLVNALAAIWLFSLGRSAGDGRTSAVEITAGALLLALSLMPRRRTGALTQPRASEARG
jgi:hypothetical protein